MRSANREVVIPLVMVSAVASIIITPEKSDGCGVIARKSWLRIEGGFGLVDRGNGKSLNSRWCKGGKGAKIRVS